jgi:hypothetical protein
MFHISSYVAAVAYRGKTELWYATLQLCFHTPGKGMADAKPPHVALFCVRRSFCGTCVESRRQNVRSVVDVASVAAHFKVVRHCIRVDAQLFHAGDEGSAFESEGKQHRLAHAAIHIWEDATDRLVALWEVVIVRYGLPSVSANTSSRMATATTCPTTFLSWLKGKNRTGSGEIGCGCKMILPSSIAHQQHANPAEVSKK